MGRKLRRVPEKWEHPKNENGRYQPMYDEYYGDALTNWIEQNRLWEEGAHPDLQGHPDRKEQYPFYAMWNGNPPDVEYYRTVKWEDKQLTHIQLYEDTSEGTPISPVFPASELEALCEYAEKNCTVFGTEKATKQEWLQMLSDGFVFHREGNMVFI